MISTGDEESGPLLPLLQIDMKHLHCPFDHTLIIMFFYSDPCEILFFLYW